MTETVSAGGFVPHHEVVEGPGAERTAFVLHGILGSAQNWRMYARKLVAAAPRWRFVLVDLRNHGESAGYAPPPHTVAACAADLLALGAALGAAPEAVIGHSFGGKVALVYARDHGERAGLGQVWALDTTPGAVRDEAEAEANSDVVRVLRGLRQVAMPVASRRDLVDILTARGFSEQLARWMTTNLRAVDGGYGWTFDLDGVEALLEDYLRTDLEPYLAQAAAREAGSAPQVHLLRAGRSTRWSPSTLERLGALADRGGAFHFHTLADADHWVHVDNPEGLRALLVAALER